MWCLNIYNEIISPNSIRSSEVDLDIKKYETEAIYTNAMTIIDSIFDFIPSLKIFMDDSQIVGNLLRLIRKSVIIVTNEEFNKGKTKDFPKEIKKLKVNYLFYI